MQTFFTVQIWCLFFHDAPTVQFINFQTDGQMFFYFNYSCAQVLPVIIYSVQNLVNF